MISFNVNRNNNNNSNGSPQTIKTLNTFTPSIASVSTLVPHNSVQVLDNSFQKPIANQLNKTLNTYEIVEYDNSTRHEQNNYMMSINNSGSLPVHRYDENTADLYSYRDFNVYQDAASLNDREEEFTRNTNITSTMNYKPPKIETPEPIFSKSLVNVGVNTVARADATNQTRLFDANDVNNYKSASTIYDIKYLVDINDLKNHLDLSNVSSNKQLKETLSSIQTDMNSQTHLVVTNPPVAQQAQSKACDSPKKSKTQKQNNKNVHIHMDSCCCPSCCGLFSFCCHIISCFSSCCLRPCCSMAAILVGLIILGCFLGGAILLGILGFIPIPNEITKNICDANSRDLFLPDTRNFTPVLNKTSIQQINRTNLTSTLATKTTKFYLSNSTSPSSLSSKFFQSTNSTLTPSENKKISALNIKNRIKSKIRMQTKFKNKISKLVALQYDVLLMPNQLKSVLSLFVDSPINTDTNNNNNINNKLSLEMKINLNVKLYCNYSTNFMHFKTREFSNIDLSFENKDKENMQVKRWNYDSSSNVLEIETTKNCTTSQIYIFNIFISHKNYGKLSGNSNLNTAFNGDQSFIKQDAQQYYLTSFNENFDIPFPILIEKFYNQMPVISGQSVFNVTLAKLKSLNLMMIFNMEIQNKTEKDGLEFVRYRPTPFMPPQTIGFIFGNLKCRDNYYFDLFSLDIRICSTNSQDTYGDAFDMIAGYVKSLIEFYSGYTKVTYDLKKIDIIILPASKFADIVNNDLIMSQIGIVYLPSTYIGYFNSFDQLTKIENKMKIINMMSKQLVRHWFRQFLEQDCDKNLFKEDFNYNSITFDTSNLIKNICDTNNCLNNDAFDRSIKMYLEFNEKCFLNKGIINWMGYLGFQSAFPDLFELIHLEWSLIKDIDDSNYFLSNQNLNYIYQSYDFPRLAESSNFEKTKTEIRSLMTVRTFYLMFGVEKFQDLINDWFKILKTKGRDNDVKNSSMSSQIDYHIDNLRFKKRDTSILNVFEQYSMQYNIVPSEFTTSIKNIIRSWMVTENDIIFNLNRNYNNKQAVLNIESSKGGKNLINFYYPFNYASCLIKGSSKEKNSKIDTNKNQITNLIWLNQTNDNIKNLPGADKYIIGNYMKMFPYFRVNYDKDNWKMLTDQILYDHKIFKLNERVQIIDDVFYLVNNEKLPISYALNILEYIPDEESFLPWKFAIKHIRTFLNNIEDDSPIYAKFRNHLIQLIKPTYHRLKWGESLADSIDEKLIRILVVDLLCSLDYEDCVENSVKQLTDSIKINVYNIPQYLSKSIYCTAIRYTGINEWFFLWKYYLNQPDNQIKDSILYSLSCSSQIWILNLLLRKLVYENSISTNELPIAFEYISKNPVGKYIVWNHISQNYQTFYNKIGNDPDIFFKILQVSTKEFKLKYEIKQVNDFIEEIGLRNFTNYYMTNNKDGIYTNIQNRITNYAKWKQSNVRDLNEWLNKKLRLKDETY